MNPRNSSPPLWGSSTDLEAGADQYPSVYRQSWQAPPESEPLFIARNPFSCRHGQARQEQPESDSRHGVADMPPPNQNDLAGQAPPMMTNVPVPLNAPYSAPSPMHVPDGYVPETTRVYVSHGFPGRRPTRLVTTDSSSGELWIKRGRSKTRRPRRSVRSSSLSSSSSSSSSNSSSDSMQPVLLLHPPPVPPNPSIPSRPVPESGLPLPATAPNKDVKMQKRTCTLLFGLSRATKYLNSVLLDLILREVYFYILLRIPPLYFSRVSRVFEDAELSLPDIKRMAQATAEMWDPAYTPFTMYQSHSFQMKSFLAVFSTFTLNVISVLLMSAILTLLQIEAASHPIIRTTALFSLICSLMSLLYGCMYIIRFGTMRKMYKAASFARDEKKRAPNIWWNVWVLLAMPVIWLAWAILTFLVSIMSFIWLTGSSQDATDVTLSPRAALGPRIGLLFVFSLGLVYSVLIMREFRRYGEPLDRKWEGAVARWRKLHPPERPAYYPDTFPPNYIALPPPISPPLTTCLSVFFRPTPESAPRGQTTPYPIMQLGTKTQIDSVAHARPAWSHAIEGEDLTRFIADIANAWNGRLALGRSDGISDPETPVYTLLQPAQANIPRPTSPGHGAGDVANQNHSPERASKPRDIDVGLETSEIPPLINSDPEQNVGPTSHSVQRTRSLHSTRSPVLGPPSVSDASDPNVSESRAQAVREFIGLWNERYFHRRGLEAVLTRFNLEQQRGPKFAVHLLRYNQTFSPAPAEDVQQKEREGDT